MQYLIVKASNSWTSLQSNASARTRYIKIIKRKWGEKWLCTREISSSSAVLCKLVRRQLVFQPRVLQQTNFNILFDSRDY